MLGFFHNRRGQAFFVQHSMTLFLVVACVAAMAVMVKRAVQARIKQARDYSLREVRLIHADAQYNIQGSLWSEYEPYYLESRSARDMSKKVETRILSGGRDGIVEYDMPETDNQSLFKTRRTQLPAEYAD